MTLEGDRMKVHERINEECELKGVVEYAKEVVEYENNRSVARLYINICRKPKVPPDAIWSTQKLFR